MVDVGEMPNAEQIAAGSDSEGEDSEDDEEEEEYEESEDEDEEDEDDEGQDEPSETSPEDAEAAAAARLEKLRIHRALGNDGDPDDPAPEPEPLWSEEEEEEESDSDADSDDSTGVAQSDYTQYVRAPRQRPARMNVSKLGRVDELKATVANDLERQRRSQVRGSGTKAKVGNQKGHKWKTNAKHVAKGAAAAGTW